MNRRDNGLPSEQWQRLTDLAPPIADHVLDVLRDEGIAAYAAPRAGETGHFLEARSTGGPLDEVFVGADGFDRARDLLDELLPQLAQLGDQPAGTPAGGSATAAAEEQPAERPSEDEIWASLVAAYSAPAADRSGHPATAPDADEDPSPARHDPVDDTGPTTPRRTATGFEDIEAEVGGGHDRPDDHEVALGEEHEHYVPPTPPPIPQGDTVTRMAWVGVLGGPLWLILATLLGWGPGGLPGLIAVLAFVGGFVTLVTRLDNDRPDDGDDGAVV